MSAVSAAPDAGRSQETLVDSALQAPASQQGGADSGPWPSPAPDLANQPPSDTTRAASATPGGCCARIALFDELPADAQALATLLEAQAEGHAVTCGACPEAFVEMARREHFDLLVVRWGSQSMHGLDVVRGIRSMAGASSSSRVLVLTAHNDEFEVVQAFDSGADDCALQSGRPFELLARVRSLLRNGRPAATNVPEMLHGFSFDVGSRIVVGNGLHVRLTPREFELARLLFRNFGRPVSRSYLFESLWESQGTLRTVDQHIGRVRHKLGLVAPKGFTLQAIYGLGYVVRTAMVQPSALAGRAMIVPLESDASTCMPSRA